MVDKNPNLQMEKQKEHKQRKKELKQMEENRKKGKGNISSFFGVNPQEVDGSLFQKKIRKEWQ